MLEEVLGSKTKIKILRKLSEDSKREFTLNELSSVLKLSHGSILPSVRQLVDARVLTTKKSGRSTLYKLNLANSLVKEMLKMFSIETNVYLILAKKFVKRIKPKKITDINSIILFGSVPLGTARLGSDIDLLFVMNKINKSIEKMIQALTQEFLEKYDVIISPMFITRGEFSSDIDFIIRVKRDGGILYERRTKR